MNNSSESTNKPASTGCVGTDPRDDESTTATESQTDSDTGIKPAEGGDQNGRP